VRPERERRGCVGKKRGSTHGDVGHLAERLVRNVRLLLMLSRREVDGDEFIGNVALFGYLGHAPRASGYVIPVKLECHDECGGRLLFGCGCAVLT